MKKPKTYVRSMDDWWLKNPFFVRYMIREGTAVFVAIYAVVLLVGVADLASGAPAYQSWLAAMKHPVVIVFHLVALAAALYHMVTWFVVSPKAMPPIYLGKKKVPAKAIVGGQYATAAAVSLFILIAAWQL